MKEIPGVVGATLLVLFLIGCPVETPEEMSSTLRINNLSGFTLFAVEYSGLDFGDITSGKEIKKEVREGTQYIFFTLQTNNGRVRCKTQALTVEAHEQAVFTIINNTVVMTAVTERRDTLINLKTALDTEPANPRLEVTRDNYSVTNNSTVDLGTVPKGTPVMVVFTLTNKNEHDLQISGNSPETSGTHAVQAGVTNYSANRLAYNAAAVFTLTFTPAAIGTNSFAVTIRSNDPVNGEYVVKFSAVVVNTWEKLYGAPGQRYGIFRAASNLSGGIYAGGYVSDSAAAIFNIDQYGTIQNQFSFTGASTGPAGTLGPLGIGSSYGDFYSVLKGMGDGYVILKASNPGVMPSEIPTNLNFNGEPLRMDPRGIIKDGDYYYTAGIAGYYPGTGNSYNQGIFVNRHYYYGTWEKGTALAVPTSTGIMAETFNCYGIEKLTNGDILLYGEAQKSGRTVAFLCAVNTSNTNPGSWTVRWTKTGEIAGQNTRFRKHFIEGTNIVILGFSDTSSIALKIPLATASVPNTALLTFGSGTTASAGIPAADNSGYVFVGGAINGPNGGEDIWIAKTNTAMTSIIWQFNYGGAGDDYAEVILELSDGFIIAGSTRSPSIAGQARKGTEDLYILKVNKDGTLDNAGAS
jgi:hypothetical protein